MNWKFWQKPEKLVWERPSFIDDEGKIVFPLSSKEDIKGPSGISVAASITDRPGVFEADLERQREDVIGPTPRWLPIDLDFYVGSKGPNDKDISGININHIIHTLASRILELEAQIRRVEMETHNPVIVERTSVVDSDGGLVASLRDKVVVTPPHREAPQEPKPEPAAFTIDVSGKVLPTGLR